MIKENWKQQTLGDIAVLVTEKSKPDPNSDYIALEHINGDGANSINGCAKGSDYKSASVKFATGDILFSKLRPYLNKVWQAQFDGFATGEALVYRAIPEQVEQDFLYLILRSHDAVQYADDRSIGTRMPRISKDVMAEFPVFVPPVEEQREIVNFVQAIDNLIQAGDREISSAKKMRGDVLNSILFGNDSKWEEALFSDIATINPRIKPLAPDTPFIEMADVDTWGRWAIPSGEKGKRGGTRASGGDTLMARITPCLENGKIAQVPTEFGYVGGSTEFIVLRATEESLPDFIFLLAQSHKVHAESIGLMVGTSGRQRVSAKDVGNISVPFPPLEEQEKIVAKMQTLDSYLESAQRSQKALKQVRKDVLHALLSGDKDVREVAEMFTTDHAVA